MMERHNSQGDSPGISPENKPRNSMGVHFWENSVRDYQAKNNVLLRIR